jgi:hypothetical protein
MPQAQTEGRFIARIEPSVRCDESPHTSSALATEYYIQDTELRNQKGTKPWDTLAFVSLGLRGSPGKQIPARKNTSVQKYAEIANSPFHGSTLSRATPQSRTAFPPALGGKDHVGDQRKRAEDQHYSREGYRCEIHFFPA